MGIRLVFAPAGFVDGVPARLSTDVVLLKAVGVAPPLIAAPFVFLVISSLSSTFSCKSQLYNCSGDTNETDEILCKFQDK